MALKLITDPSAEPVTVAEAKTHLRVDHSDEDTYIGLLIKTARQWVEEYTRRAILTQTWTLSLDAVPGSRIALPRPPLQSVTHIKFYDEADAATTVSSTFYQVDTSGEPGRVLLKSTGYWPSVSLMRPAAGVVVTYVAGWTAAGSVPEPFKQAIKLLVGHLYENREDVTQSNGLMVTIPMGAKMVLWPWRVMEF
jgi:uncharacterized phiE125 gp8 family phage protein